MVEKPRNPRVIEIPEGYEELGEAFLEVLRSVQSEVTGTAGGKYVDYGRVEERLARATAQVESSSNRRVLQALDIDAPVVVIGGIRYHRVGRCADDYHTMAGSVSVERSLYRASGTRGGDPAGKVVDTVSLRAGVVGNGWLPRTARAMAHAVQQGTSREAEASARESLRLGYTRSSYERVAHLVGALAVAERQDVEDALIEAYEVPTEAASVSVSIDRVSVPMEEPRPRPVGRPRKDAARRPVARNYRMAYCGTVTLHDKKGEAIHTIRYGCMPEGDMLGMRNRLVADAAALLAKESDLKLELLCDGAPEMWNLLDAWFTTEHFGPDIYRLVDLHHLLEKLSAAAAVIHGNAAREQVARWKLDLLNREDAAQEILEELIASGRDEGTGADHPVHAAITYLTNHAQKAEHMNYAQARRLGMPLGSGNVEATCKSIFEVRLKRCGSRWKTTSGEHIVQLRALAQSDRWGHAVELILRPLRKSAHAA